MLASTATSFVWLHTKLGGEVAKEDGLVELVPRNVYLGLTVGLASLELLSVERTTRGTPAKNDA